MNGTLRLRLLSSSTAAFARGYLITMRPYLLFVSGITGIAGMSFGGGVDVLRGLSIAASSFCAYGFGQALTDCFQTDTDSISSPYRPLVRGMIPRGAVLVVSLAGLTGCVAVLSYWNPLNAWLGLAAGAGLATYTWFKRRWWGGPWYNAWIVCVLLLMGVLAAGVPGEGIHHSFGWCLAGTFFAYANFVLAGYFKDIGADAATGYDTLPVRFGRKCAVIASDLLAAGVAVSAAGMLASAERGGAGIGGAPPGALLFSGSALAALLLGQARLHGNRTDSSAHAAVVPVVHSYVLLLSGAAACVRPSWFAPLAGFYAVFCVVLSRRPEQQQI